MNTPNQLENKLKPDWKEWIPIYGVYQVGKDIRTGRFVPPERYGRFVGLIIYQGLFGAAGVMGASAGLYYTSEFVKRMLEWIKQNVRIGKLREKS